MASNPINTNRKVLWENPNPTSTMSLQEIDVDDDMTKYSEIEVIYKTASIYSGLFSARAPYSAGMYLTLVAGAGDSGEFSGNITIGIRTITFISPTKLSVGGGKLMKIAGNDQNNYMCTPVKVIGIL